MAVLDSPGNHPPGSQADPRYVVQVVITWPFRAGFLNKPSETPFPSTWEDSVELIRQFAESWAEPFHSLANSICPSFEIKHLQLYDWLPPKEVHGTGNIALVGDALHLMAMCKALFSSDGNIPLISKQTGARAQTMPLWTCLTSLRW